MRFIAILPSKIYSKFCSESACAGLGIYVSYCDNRTNYTFCHYLRDYFSKHVVIHVPYKVKTIHHTHTITKHIHHGGGDKYEVLGYTVGHPIDHGGHGGSFVGHDFGGGSGHDFGGGGGGHDFGGGGSSGSGHDLGGDSGGHDFGGGVGGGGHLDFGGGGGYDFGGGGGFEGNGHDWSGR